jgi:branched-chain amino acid transport system ATP-binding protein
MSPPLLSVGGLSKRFGGFTALEGINLEIPRGERFGLIGPNGSGKTTLINCIAGTLRADRGSVKFKGEEIGQLPAYARTRRGIARSFQIPRPFRSMTVRENLLVAIDFATAGHGLSVRATEEQAQSILDTIGLTAKAGTLSGSLSQVELRKLELARAMAARPELLISDEAMAGLAGSGVEEILQLLTRLNRDGVTIVMIEHIMQAVMRFSERVMCLDAGRIVCTGTPKEVMGNRQVQEAYLGA